MTEIGNGQVHKPNNRTVSNILLKAPSPVPAPVLVTSNTLAPAPVNANKPIVRPLQNKHVTRSSSHVPVNTNRPNPKTPMNNPTLSKESHPVPAPPSTPSNKLASAPVNENKPISKAPTKELKNDSKIPSVAPGPFSKKNFQINKPLAKSGQMQSRQGIVVPNGPPPPGIVVPNGPPPGIVRPPPGVVVPNGPPPGKSVQNGPPPGIVRPPPGKGVQNGPPPGKGVQYKPPILKGPGPLLRNGTDNKTPQKNGVQNITLLGNGTDNKTPQKNGSQDKPFPGNSSQSKLQQMNSVQNGPPLGPNGPPPKVTQTKPHQINRVQIKIPPPGKGNPNGPPPGKGNPNGPPPGKGNPNGLPPGKGNPNGLPPGKGQNGLPLGKGVQNGPHHVKGGISVNGNQNKPLLPANGIQKLSSSPLLQPKSDVKILPPVSANSQLRPNVKIPLNPSNANMPSNTFLGIPTAVTLSAAFADNESTEVIAANPHVTSTKAALLQPSIIEESAAAMNDALFPIKITGNLESEATMNKFSDISNTFNPSLLASSPVLIEENGRLSRQRDAVTNVKRSQKRLALLNENYVKKNNEYLKMVIASICGLVIIGLLVFLGIPTGLFLVISVLVGSVITIYCLTIYGGIISRDHINFDQLNIPKPHTFNKETNLASLDRRFVKAKSATSICSTKDCCSSSTVWDEKTQLCEKL